MTPQLSLKKLFLIWLSSLAILSFLASLIIAYFSSYQETSTAALELSKTKTSRLALLAERLLTSDTSLLKETISEIAANRYVREVLIVDSDDNVIFASSQSLIGLSVYETPLAEYKTQVRKESSSVPTAKQLENKIILSSATFNWPAYKGVIRSNKKGWIFITTNIDAKLNNAIKAEVGDRVIAFFIVLLITVVTWFVAFRQIAQPLTILTQAAQRVSCGDYKFNIPDMRFKEFNLIRDSFINMVNEVERKFSAVSDSENRFRLLLSKAPVGIVAFDGNMILRHVNEGFIGLTGLKKDSSVGTSMEQLCKSMSAIAKARVC